MLHGRGGSLDVGKVHGIQQAVAKWAVGMVLRVQIMLHTHCSGDESGTEGNLTFVWPLEHRVTELHGSSFTKESALLVTSVIPGAERP